MIPQKKSVYEDIRENLNQIRLPPIQSPAGTGRPLAFAQSCRNSHDKAFFRTPVPKIPVLAMNSSKSAQGTPKSNVFSEVKMLKTEKELRLSIKAPHHQRFSSMNEAPSQVISLGSNALQPKDFSVFSPKRESLPLKKIEISAKLKKTAENNEMGKNQTSKIKFAPGISKYYSEDPKEVYQRIFERANKQGSRQRSLQIDSLRDGKVILCKKNNMILRNDSVLKILAEPKDFSEE